MAWLKQWDECVFKRHLGAGSKKRMRAEAAAALQESGAAPADPLGRPRERVRRAPLTLVALRRAQR